MSDKVSDQWKAYMASGDVYRYRLTSKMQYLLFKWCTCSWRLKQIIRLGKVKQAMKILDFGAGGGHDSIPLAYMGYEVDALDCSDIALRNLIAYKESVEKYAKRKLKIGTIVADIVDARILANTYDVVFSCGVMEHFLDRADRNQVYKILAALLKKGGRLVTFVPNGNHPLRTVQREKRLGGYSIEEIDYDLGVFKKDIEGTPLTLERVRGFDLFGYVLTLPNIANNKLVLSFVKALHLFIRLFENLLLFAFTRKYAYWLFFVAVKE